MFKGNHVRVYTKWVTEEDLEGVGTVHTFRISNYQPVDGRTAYECKVSFDGDDDSTLHDRAILV